MVPSDYILRVIRQNKNQIECRGDGTLGNGKIWGILATAGYPKLVVNSVRSYGLVWMCRVAVCRRKISQLGIHESWRIFFHDHGFK